MPDRISYQLSLLAAQRLLKVPRLGQAEWSKYPDGKPMIWSGAYAAVFRGTDPQGRQWALRCPLQDFANSEQQHRTVSEYLASNPLPYLVQFEYIPRGFIVDGALQPVTVSEWVPGPSIKTFVGQNLRAATKVRLVWEWIARDMVERGLAHGDVHHDNLLVNGDADNPSMRLIDYDSFVVPANVGQVEGIAGALDYQHPNRRTMSRHKHPRVDAFSMLVMDLTLRALAEFPSLWTDLKLDVKSEGFLLGQADYKNPGASKVFARLLALGGAVEVLARGVIRALADPDPLRSPYPWELVGLSDAPPIDVRPAPSTVPPWMTGARPVPKLPLPALLAAPVPVPVPGAPSGPSGKPDWMLGVVPGTTQNVQTAATGGMTSVATPLASNVAVLAAASVGSAVTQQVMPRGLRIFCIVGLVLYGLSFLGDLLKLGALGGSLPISYGLVRDVAVLTACAAILIRSVFGFKLLRATLAVELFVLVLVFPIWLFKYSGMRMNEMTMFIFASSATVQALMLAAALVYLNRDDIKDYQASIVRP